MDYLPELFEQWRAVVAPPDHKQRRYDRGITERQISDAVAVRKFDRGRND